MRYHYFTYGNVTMDRQATALARTIDILGLLGRKGSGVSFTTLQATSGGTPAPTLSRLLKSLLQVELARKDPKSGLYTLGPRALSLSAELLGARTTRELVEPVVRALAESTEQSAAYYEPDGSELVLMAKTEVAESFHYIPVFGRVPELARHGFSQMYLAHLPSSERRRLVRDSGYCPAVSERNFEVRCERAVRSGYLVETGEHRSGVTRIVGAVTGPEGYVGSIGISVLGHQTQSPRSVALVEAVVNAAQDASRVVVQATPRTHTSNQ